MFPIQNLMTYNVKDYGALGNGVADDTAAIQYTIKTCQNAGGGIVFLPAGVYRTSASLVISADNITLCGVGFSSVIKPLSGATFDVISTPIPATSGLAGYVRNYPGVRDLMLDCSAMAGTVAGQGNGIHFYGARYGFIRDVFISGCLNYCIMLEGDASPNFGYNTSVRGNIFDLCAAGIYVTGSEAHDIRDNKFKYAGTALAAAQPTFSSPSTVARHLTLTGGYAHVDGNVFGNSGPYTTEAILITSGAPCRITGNRFDTVHAEAIHTTGGSHIIEANTFTSCGSSNTGKACVSLGSAGNVVKGNTWDNSNGTTQSSYCVQENGAYTSNEIEGNLFVTGTAGVVSLNANTRASVRNNIGYNPRGAAVTQLAVAATGVALTNTTGCDCMLLVGGGTITQIAIGGVNTGQTSGWFRIPAGQTVTLTYSVAPTTFQWFGD